MLEKLGGRVAALGDPAVERAALSGGRRVLGVLACDLREICSLTTAENVSLALQVSRRLVLPGRVAATYLSLAWRDAGYRLENCGPCWACSITWRSRPEQSTILQ